MTRHAHDWLNLTEPEFVECRQIRHAWEGARALYDFGGGVTGRVLRCDRCGCRREELFANGRRVSNRMVYPDGYQKPKGAPPGRVPPREVLATLLESTRAKKSAYPPELADRLAKLKPGALR